jgi:hypothetical protein
VQAGYYNMSLNTKIIMQVHFTLVVIAKRYLVCNFLNYCQITYHGHIQLYRYMNITLDIVCCLRHILKPQHFRSWLLLLLSSDYWLLYWHLLLLVLWIISRIILSDFKFLNHQMWLICSVWTACFRGRI